MKNRSDANDTSHTLEPIRETVFIKRTVFLILFMGIVIAVVTLFPFYEALTKVQLSEFKNDTKQEAQHIAQILSKLQDVTKQISSRTKARQILETYNKKLINIDAAQKGLSEILSDALGSSEILGISRYTKDKIPLVTLGISTKDNLCFQSGTIENIEFHVTKEDTHDYLLLCSPIIDKEGSAVGFDKVLFDVQEIKSILTQKRLHGDKAMFYKKLDNVYEPTFEEKHDNFIKQGSINLDTISEQSLTTLLIDGEQMFALKYSLQNGEFAFVALISKELLFQTPHRELLRIGGGVFAVGFVGLAGIFYFLFPLLRENTKIFNLYKQSETELKKLNSALGERVDEEVAKRRSQEVLLMQQAKFTQMSEMLNNITHHWRQPLNVIALNIQNIEDIYSLGEMTEEFMHDKVESTMEVIQEMSDTLSEFGGFIANDDVKRYFSIRECLKKTLKLHEPSLKTYHIALQCECDVDGGMFGNPAHLINALQNILQNAKQQLQASNAKEKRIVATLYLDGHGETIVIKVCDNGGGIKPDALEKIFNPFFTTKDLSSTAGNGLYFAKLMVEKGLNGAIKGYNENEGACFEITLPLSKNDSIIFP